MATVAVPVAGCTGDGGSSGNGGDGEDGGAGGGTASPTATGVSGTEYPLIDRWLTETDVGGADDTYDGTLVDTRDREELTVDVGAPGNGDHFAFAPSAVVVSAGTTIRWAWTGEGGAHNVDAEPDDQLGESDYTFSSGDPVESSEKTYTQTLDSTGIALYHCEPHFSLGMKGGIAVV